VIGDILQPTHLLFVLVIALLVLGPKRLPEVGRALGKGLADLRSTLSSADPREELRKGSIEPIGPAAALPATAAQPPATAQSPPAAQADVRSDGACDRR